MNTNTFAYLPLERRKPSDVEGLNQARPHPEPLLVRLELYPTGVIV